MIIYLFRTWFLPKFWFNKKPCGRKVFNKLTTVFNFPPEQWSYAGLRWCDNWSKISTKKKVHCRLKFFHYVELHLPGGRYLPIGHGPVGENPSCLGFINGHRARFDRARIFLLSPLWGRESAGFFPSVSLVRSWTAVRWKRRFVISKIFPFLGRKKTYEIGASLSLQSVRL